MEMLNQWRMTDKKTKNTTLKKGWTSPKVTMVTSRTGGDILDEYTHIKDLKDLHA